LSPWHGISSGCVDGGDSLQIWGGGAGANILNKQSQTANSLSHLVHQKLRSHDRIHGLIFISKEQQLSTILEEGENRLVPNLILMHTPHTNN
jgi:hypothetical protein